MFVFVFKKNGVEDESVEGGGESARVQATRSLSQGGKNGGGCRRKTGGEKSKEEEKEE